MGLWWSIQSFLGTVLVFACEVVWKMAESRLKTTITNAKVDVENFDGQNNFGLWQSDLKDTLYLLDLDLVFKEIRPDDTRESDYERLNIKTCGLICSYLAKKQKYTFL